jgi:hypothetical protein
MTISTQHSGRSFIDTRALVGKQERVSGIYRIVIPALQATGS